MPYISTITTPNGTQYELKAAGFSNLGDVGSEGRPIYIDDGIPVAGTFSWGADEDNNVTVSWDGDTPEIVIPTTTALAINKGGTGATTANQARINLGMGGAATYDVVSMVQDDDNLVTNGAIKRFVEGKGYLTEIDSEDVTSALGYTPPSSDTNNRRVFYGICETAAATKDKVVTLSDDTGWELLPGTIVGVKFTHTNTYSSATANPITLNVNSTGAKNIWYNTTHSGAGNTGTNTTIYGTANRHTWYMYDGTYWVWIHYGVVSNSNTVPSAQCETAAGTAAKTATCTNHTLTANTYCHFNIRYSNTAKSALTMNVDSSGAKPIYINGAASSASNYTLPAGTYLAFYNGTNWYFDTNGGIPFQMGGGDTWVSTSADSSDTPEDIILREIAAIASRPNGHYVNATSWVDHLNGYSINIIKTTYGSNSGTMYNGTLVLNGGDDENSVSYPFASNGTWVHLGKNKTVSASGVCLAVSTSAAYMFVPFDVGNTNYTATVTGVGSIVNVGAPTSITIQSKYTNGCIITINRTGLTNGNSYFLSGAIITLTYT